MPNNNRTCNALISLSTIIADTCLQDGGKTWNELTSALPLFAHGATLDGSLSWTGKTLVLHGTDRSAISRGAYGTNVWKSVDDGDSWTDETGDLVTISLGSGYWYEVRILFFVFAFILCTLQHLHLTTGTDN